MSFSAKVKETLISRAAEGLGVAVGVILIWMASVIGPAILPAISTLVSTETLATLLAGSFALNIVLVILFWIFFKSPDLKLKYGIFWDRDKNPYCPNCKIPISGYDEYNAGKGYYCKPCKKIFPLKDQSGVDVSPEKAMSEL
ncbi:MAG: hypothetical protein MRY76_14625 [Pseudomonadales bacterium]|nr:hypothetical protein [Pseudomonadales bacterium]